MGKSIFIMGLPAAGKTTYLAALWHCLTNKQKTKLKIVKYNNDQTYLSSISQLWADANELPRTNFTTEKRHIILTLSDEQNEVIEIDFPDLSGETFKQQYKLRNATIDIVNQVKKCDGMVLFINPLTIKEPFLLSEIPLEFRDESEAVALGQRDIENDPTDVLLVELLQFVNIMREEEKYSISIVVSAWDLISTRYKEYVNNPNGFIKKKLPLLWQYLSTNDEFINVFYFGVSAQGGELTNCDEILTFDEPYEKIMVVDANGARTNDITVPINVLLG